jgi:hypothetical protein
MALNFPDAPTTNQLFPSPPVAGVPTYKWDGAKWIAANTSASGLGTMATQNATAVAITGGAVNGTPIGGTTPAAGSFTTMSTTGAVTIAEPTGSNTQLILNKAASGFADNIFGETAGVARWVLQLGNGDAESTGDAGSNFVVYPYTDAGALKTTALIINRASLNATFGGTFVNIQPATGGSGLQLYKNLSGQNTQIETFTGTNARWLMQMGDYTPEGGSDAGSNFNLYPYTDAGAQKAAIISARRDNQVVTIGGTGGLAINPPAGQNALLQLYKPASGYGCQINTFTGSNMRWSQQMGDSTAETGSDTGSNFNLYNFKDNGTYQTALSITRATGLATVAGDPTTGLGIATKQYVDKAPRLIQSGNVSNVANIVFSFPGGYSTYRLIMNRLEPVTAAVALYGFVSVNNGSSYYQATGNYNWAGKFVVYSGTEGIWTSSAQFSSGFALTAGNMAAASGTAAFWIVDIYPGSGSNLGTILWKCYYGGVWYAGGGALVATGAVWTNFLVLFSSGNIAGCGYQLYGFN